MSSTSPTTTDDGVVSSERRREILQTFANEVNDSIDRALAALSSLPTGDSCSDSTPRTTTGEVNHGQTTTTTPESSHNDKWRNLGQVRQLLQTIVKERVTATQQQLRHGMIANSLLLRQSDEIIKHVSSYLDEVALLSLEESTSHLYTVDYTCGVKQPDEQDDLTREEQRNASTDTDTPNLPLPPWKEQWIFLDKYRECSKSSLLQLLDHNQENIQGNNSTTPSNNTKMNNPHTRGILWAKASRLAAASRTAHKSPAPTPPTNYYHRDDFTHDFQYFFHHNPAPRPPLEFFICITVADTVLLEGFQSNFQSLRFIQECKDQGHHTYIAVGGDQLASQAVMVRHNPPPLARAMMQGTDGSKKMGTSARATASTLTKQVDGDDDTSKNRSDSEDEDDDDDYLWPPSARRSFLEHATITILQCGLSQPVIPPTDSTASTSRRRTTTRRQNGGDTTTATEQEIEFKLVGTTSGYYESEQHFAIFNPIVQLPQTTAPTTTTTTTLFDDSGGTMDHYDNHYGSDLLLAGAVCGGDDSEEQFLVTDDGDGMIVLMSDGRLVVGGATDDDDDGQCRLKIGLGCSVGDSLHIVFKWEWE